MMLYLAILVQYGRVTEGRTYGRTHDNTIYHTCIASRGRNVNGESFGSLGLGVSTVSVCFMIFSVQFFVFSARSSNISNGASKSVFSAWPNFSSVNCK